MVLIDVLALAPSTNIHCHPSFVREIGFLSILFGMTRYFIKDFRQETLLCRS